MNKHRRAPSKSRRFWPKFIRYVGMPLCALLLMLPIADGRRVFTADLFTNPLMLPIALHDTGECTVCSIEEVARDANSIQLAVNYLGRKRPILSHELVTHDLVASAGLWDEEQAEFKQNTITIAAKPGQHRVVYEAQYTRNRQCPFGVCAQNDAPTALLTCDKMIEVK